MGHEQLRQWISFTHRPVFGLAPIVNEYGIILSHSYLIVSLVFTLISQLLEACVKNCGKPLHQELGKFRFLNELIRIISPKVAYCTFEVNVFRCALLYAWVPLCCLLLCSWFCCLNWQYLASEISENTKKKVKELLYSWKIGLPHEPKIAEAYEMLKKQGETGYIHSSAWNGKAANQTIVYVSSWMYMKSVCVCVCVCSKVLFLTSLCHLIQPWVLLLKPSQL